MLSLDDGIMRLRMRLNEKFGQRSPFLAITIGREYQWGWSLYYQDRRPKHFLVGHGPVLFNRLTGDLREYGSAQAETWCVERYEFTLGIRDDHRVILTAYDKSPAHLRYHLHRAGLAWDGTTIAPGMALLHGSLAHCRAMADRFAQEGLAVEITPEFLTGG